MELFLVVLDWIFLIITFLGEVFYLCKIIKEEDKVIQSSVLMDMMKYLLLNDVISLPIVLFHDVPSYFMEISLSDRFLLIKELGILSHCFQFFYALLMLPVFALLNLIAIFAVYMFVAIKKRKISQISIAICYLSAIIWSTPLLTSYCGFEYNSTKHIWHYDYTRPYTAIYQNANLTLQIFVLSTVSISMTVVLWYLARKRNKLCSQTTVQNITRNSNSQTRITHLNSNVIQIAQTSSASSSLIGQAVAFIVLCLCFICGTVSFNFFYWSVSLSIPKKLLVMPLAAKFSR